jgi:hypothetical protein
MFQFIWLYNMRLFLVLLLVRGLLDFPAARGSGAGVPFPMAEYEDSLKSLFFSLREASTPVERGGINRKIIAVFQEALKHPDAFSYPFDSLQYAGKITSPDNLLRILTWNYSDTPADHYYGGFLLYRDKEAEATRVFFLNHDRGQKEDPGNRLFHHNDWYGSLYYQVRDVEYSGRTYYTLIGFDFNNMVTNKKIVDVLSFPEGSPVFGAPIFQLRHGIMNRLVFEYSSQVVMFLRYVPEKEMIIYDHLSPASPRLSGQYRFYGPDFSYDGLKFERGRWIHVSDLDWKP